MWGGLHAKNVVATWCGLHKVRTWASRSNQDDNCCRLWHREGPPSPPQPCPILHKQEATGNCRRLIRWISRNQIWPFLCPAQDSLVAKDRRKGLTQDSISKYYKESTLALALAQVLGPRTASFKKPFAQAQLLGKCGRVRTTSQKLWHLTIRGTCYNPPVRYEDQNFDFNLWIS